MLSLTISLQLILHLITELLLKDFCHLLLVKQLNHDAEPPGNHIVLELCYFCRVSIPFKPGMFSSKNTTSNGFASTSSRASTPLLTPVTSYPFSLRNKMCGFNNSISSSAQRICGRPISVCIRAPSPFQGVGSTRILRRLSPCTAPVGKVTSRRATSYWNEHGEPTQNSQ